MTAEGGTLELAPGLEVVGESTVSRVGDVLRLGGRLAERAEGRGMPASRRGTRSKTEVGIRMISSRNPGEFAKTVIDRSKGETRMRNSAGKWIDRWGGSRVLRVEWSAMEAWKVSHTRSGYERSACVPEQHWKSC